MSAITITDAGRNLLRDSLRGSANPLIKYVALGTSSTTPASGDIKLGNEVFRKAVTSYAIGTAGEILISMYLAPSDAVGVNIQEVGFFGASSATNVANTGVLFARGLYVRTHVNTERITFQLDLQL